MADFPQKTKCVDDVLLWESSTVKCLWQDIEFIYRCAPQGVTFKIPWHPTTLLLLWLTSLAQIYVPVTSIYKFPTPKNLTDVRSWVGLLNQVSYAFSMAAMMLPFRELLKPGTHMSGLQSWIRSFRNLKRPLSERLRKAWESSTHKSIHALLSTGTRAVLAFGCSRSTVTVDSQVELSLVYPGRRWSPRNRRRPR